MSSASAIERINYRWIHLFGAGYCALIGIGSFAAYLADGLWLRAIICVGMQGFSIAFMLMCIHNTRNQAPVAAVASFVMGIACGSVAAIGIQHAWVQDGDHLAYVLAWLIAAVEPILFVMADHSEAVQRDGAKRRAAAAREEEQQAHLDHQRQQLRLMKEFGEHGLRVVAGGSVIASGQALATPIEAPVQAPASATRAPMASTYTGYERPHDHVRALYEAGERSPTAIHKQVKALSRQRISAMIHQWEREADKASA